MYGFPKKLVKMAKAEHHRGLMADGQDLRVSPVTPMRVYR